jgi:hypothetical protein
METNHAHRAALACSLFLHAGYIGAATVAAGLIQLLAGEASGLSALALTFFGGLLAAASWRRARIVVERVDRARAATARLQRSNLPGPFTRARVQLPHRAELG